MRVPIHGGSKQEEAHFISHMKIPLQSDAAPFHRKELCPKLFDRLFNEIICEDFL